MAIQNRRGAYVDLNPAKAVPGELLVVQSGDPNATDGKAVYITFASGDIKMLATKSDLDTMIEDATGDIVQDLEDTVDGYADRAETAATTAETIISGAEATIAAKGAEQIAAIQAQGAQTIASIPEDYTEMSGDVTQLKADLSDVNDIIGNAKNLITSLTPGYYTNNGTINNNANYCHTNVIDVSDISEIVINGSLKTHDATQFPALGVFLNNSNELVATLYSIVRTNQQPWRVLKPDGATRLIINCDFQSSASLPSDLTCAKPSKTIAFYNDISDDKKIKFIACAVRNSGNGWKFINDNAHNPLNAGSLSVDNNGKLVLDYGFTAKKVLSLLACPDETFTKMYTIGGSVGLSQTLFDIVSLPKTIGGMIQYNGTNWITNYSDFTSFSFNESTGALTITHEDLANIPTKELFKCTAIGRRCTIQLGELSTNSITLYFLDNNGNVKTTPDTDMRAYVTREINANNIDANNVISSTGNFWIFGVMEI